MNKDATPVDIYEIPKKDHFICPMHPGFTIEALYFNKTTHKVCLCCVKCFTQDSEITRNQRVWPILDIFKHYMNPTKPFKEKDVEDDNIEWSKLEGVVKEYMEKYKEHVENKYQVMDECITGLIDGLSILKKRYKACQNTGVGEGKEKVGDQGR